MLYITHMGRLATTKCHLILPKASENLTQLAAIRISVYFIYWSNATEIVALDKIVLPRFSEMSK